MPFKAILKELTTRAHASGAIMLDFEGEAVDQYSAAADHAADHELSAVGAHKGIILNMVRELAGRMTATGEVNSICLSTSTSRLAIVPLKEGYYIIVTLDRHEPVGRVLFECKRAIKRFEEEMGL